MDKKNNEVIRVVIEAAKKATMEQKIGACESGCCGWGIEYIDAKIFISSLEESQKSLDV